MSTEDKSAAAPAKGRFTLAICFLVAVLEGYDLQVISSAGPQLAQVMNLRPDQIGIFFSASLVGLAIGAVAGGWLADRYGRKPALIWSVVALGVFTFATALVSTYEGLLITRVLAGIGLGGAMPTLIAMVAEVSGGKNTTSAVTTMICGQPTGGIISALTGQTVATTYGWQSLFVVGGVLTILIVPLMMKTLPETKAPLHGAPGGDRMSAGRALFGDGRTGGTIFLWAVFILTLALLSILLSWTPLLVTGKGLPRPVGLNAIIALNVGGILGGIAISRLIDRYGVRWPMLALYVVTGVGLYLFAHATTATSLLILAVFVGFGVLGAQFSLYGVAPRLYPLEGRGAGVGIAVAMGRIGSILGPIAVGGYIRGGATEDQTVLMLAPVAIVAGLSLYALTVLTRGTLSPRPTPAR